MHDGEKMKVLLYNSDNDTYQHLRQLFNENDLSVEMSVAGINHMTPSLYNSASLIITDQSFWKAEDAVSSIRHLRTYSSVPVIAWCNAVNENIMTAVFSINYVYFVNRMTGNESLLNTLKKISPGFE